MKGMMGGAALVAAMMTLTPLNAEAQRGPGGQRGMTNRLARPGVEHIMRLRDRLELSEDQINRLDAIRSEVVQHRASHHAQAEELRSQVMAGQLEASEAREQAEMRREQGQAFAEEIRSRVEAILTDAQKEELEDVVGRARAFARGRASARTGGRSGVRGGRGAWRGQQRPMGRGGVRGARGWGRQGMMGPRRGRMMPGGEEGFEAGEGFDFGPEFDFGPPPEGFDFGPGDGFWPDEGLGLEPAEVPRAGGPGSEQAPPPPPGGMKDREVR